MDRELLDDLRAAYGGKVTERAGKATSPWKERVRARFLVRLREAGSTRLLEIGAGTGTHGAFFADEDLKVTCTDLSPEMVSHCQARGLQAQVMNLASLDFAPDAFDAVFAMNCLLHVPRTDLPGVLAGVARVLVAGGLFFWGQYGGHGHEGAWPEDHYEPKRFFSLLTDDDIRQFVSKHFELLSFEAITLDDRGGSHFQALTSRRG